MAIVFHPKLGGLVPLEQPGRYLSFAELRPGIAIEVRVWLEDGESLGALLERFCEHLDVIAGSEEQIKSQVADVMYPRYLKNWADEPAASREDFVAALAIDFISFSSSDTSVYFPSEHFAGHWLIAEMSQPPKVQHVEMFG